MAGLWYSQEWVTLWPAQRMNCYCATLGFEWSRRYTRASSWQMPFTLRSTEPGCFVMLWLRERWTSTYLTPTCQVTYQAVFAFRVAPGEMLLCCRKAAALILSSGIVSLGVLVAVKLQACSAATFCSYCFQAHNFVYLSPKSIFKHAVPTWTCCSVDSLFHNIHVCPFVK